jgi:methylenetetrahydrofolate dehydrogenase (NADP+)/methenyltetrahydrofolate cyclohydrolase
MVAKLLDGEATAAKIREEVAKKVEMLRKRGTQVGLGTILVGDDGPSARYVSMKHKDCEEVGIASFHQHLDASVSEEELLSVISSYNKDPRIHSYLVQLPLPDHIDADRVLASVDPAKDVDGLHPVNLGFLVVGRPRVLPCTPAGIVELLRAHDIQVAGKHVALIGRGLTIGRPLALMLSMNQPHLNAAVTVLHSGVPNLARFTLEADIVISAAGSPGLVKPDMVRPGAVAVGAGTTFEGKRLISDLADGVEQVASWVTPRKGGVGPMTRAMLLVNAVKAAEATAGVA